MKTGLACLLPAGTSFSPVLTRLPLLCVLFTLATSCCHLEHYSICNLKSISFPPRSSGKVFQSLTLPCSCIHGARVTSSTVSSPSILGLCTQLVGLPSFSADMFSCILHTYSLSHHRCYIPLIFCRRTSDSLILHTWGTFPDCMLQSKVFWRSPIEGLNSVL